ncbi:unnamed protein product [Amoebophrya sp. A120]|nr:unnamed protein product [Amoebophrya sp. A120]|eukprot:GSA120T00021801001.1
MLPASSAAPGRGTRPSGAGASATFHLPPAAASANSSLVPPPAYTTVPQLTGFKPVQSHPFVQRSLSPEFLQSQSKKLEEKLLQVDDSVKLAKDSKTQAVQTRQEAENVYAQTRKLMEEFVRDWNQKSAFSAQN